MKLLLRFIFGIFLSAAFSAEATHIAGGQITYKCLEHGNFEFTVSIIRDCGGNTAGFGNTSITLNGPHGTTSLPLVASFDFGPRCASATSMTCNPPSTGLGSAGAQSKFIFKGIVNLAALSPAPVSVGYTFWVTLPCCRSNVISNSLAVSGSQSLVVRMYRFTDPLTGNALSPAQLCDASPDFLQDQAMVFLNNPQDTIRLQHSGFDRNLEDSLVYRVIAPLNDQRIPYAFTSPYSLSNPIPGLLGPNVVGAGNFPINPANGEVVFMPSVLGSFVMPVQILAFRRGQLIAEVTRDQIIRVVPYSTGTPPTIPGSNVAFMQRAPQILPPASLVSGQNGFVWDFYAGDTVRLFLRANDYFPSLSGDPSVPSTWVPVLNPLRLALNGPMISTDHVAATGCALPNCASMRGLLDPLPPTPIAQLPVNLQQGNGLLVGQGYGGVVETGAQFHWATSCALMPAIGGIVPFQFRVIAMDSACLLEGRNDATVTVRLHDLPLTTAPLLTRLSFDTVHLEYTLHFRPNIDTVSIDPFDRDNFPQLSPAALKARSVGRRLASFGSYRIYRSNQAQGPWQWIGETTRPFDSTFTDSSVFAVGHTVFYQIRSISGCAAQEVSGNTLSATFSFTSVPQLVGRISIQLVPNPGRDWYRLQGLEGAFLPKVWQLRDMQGRVVKQIMVPASSATFAFDMSDLPAGVYLLQSAEVGTHFRLMHQPGQ